MKNIKNLLLITVILPLVFAACKYEEGPGISFRQKRQRISNTWMITNVEVDGATNTAALNSFKQGDSLQLLLSIYAGGGYGLMLQYTAAYSASTNWNKYYVSNHVPDYDYTKNGLYMLIGSGGKWSFDNKWEYINFGPYDLSYASGQAKPVPCKIIMLANEKLKLSYTDPATSKVNVLTFEPGSL